MSVVIDEYGSERLENLVSTYTIDVCDDCYEDYMEGEGGSVAFKWPLPEYVVEPTGQHSGPGERECAGCKTTARTLTFEVREYEENDNA